MLYFKEKHLFLLFACLFISSAAHAKISSLKKFKIPLFSKASTSANTEKTDKSKNNTEKVIYPWLGTVAEIVSLIGKKAFKEPDFSDFFQEALKAAVPYIDAHSAFFSKEAYKSTIESTSGEFSGIGVSIISKTPQDDALVIVEVIQGGPAHKAGLKAGDKIVEVNGEKLRGLSTDEVIIKLKGKIKTEVKLKIIRNKKPLEFKIKRDIIKDQTSLCYYLKNQNIYYLKLTLFTEMAAKQMAQLLKKANEGKCNGIVLDLRRNPGGILDSAIDIANLFLPKKSLVVITKDKTGKTLAEYHTKKDPVLKTNVPIFIIIDNFTASASEILAGCLRYYSEKNNKLMTFLVGTSTFGKGSVQEVIPISNGCALKLTTMLYYLPNHKTIQAIGIEPDFLVKPRIVPAEELKWINELYGKETTLKHHITLQEAEGKKKSNKKGKKNQIKKDEEKEKSWEEKQREAIQHDIQIQTSINMINMLNLAKKCYPKEVDTRQKTVVFLRKNYITDQEIELEKIK